MDAWMNMEILTVCYWTKPVGDAAQKAIINKHLSHVVNIGIRRGFCSQVTSQSSNVLALFFYLVLLRSIAVMSAVQGDQSVMLKPHEHGSVYLLV